MAHRQIREHRRDIQLAGVLFLDTLQSSGHIHAEGHTNSSFSDLQATNEAYTHSWAAVLPTWHSGGCCGHGMGSKSLKPILYFTRLKGSTRHPFTRKEGVKSAWCRPMAMTSCEGILLYYKYVDLASRQEDVRQWFLTLCEELQLKGRIRVARDGINCTVDHDAFLHVPLKRAPSCQLVI